ncbi:MAG: helix-turn-helix transcriptional regulator [Firmicutes bacterium]|nr:helix-turn-helix transcriptional regulator [Bacillota bacterium]
MRTWDDYKEHVKAVDPQGKKYVEEAEIVAEIISAVIQQRNALGLSQRDLAALCEMPQSSVARIESMRITPSLETMLRMMKPLGLKLTVTAIE